MNRKSLIFLNLLLISTIGCEDSNPWYEVINVDLDNGSKLKIGCNIESIVPLEMSESSLLGDISKIEFYQERFFIIDSRQSKCLYVFQKNGKFINCTTSGKGPGEVIHPFSFSINSNDSTIILHDQTKRSNIVYDLNLNYIRSYSLAKRTEIMDFSNLSKDTFLVYHNLVKRTITNEIQTTFYSILTDNFNKEIQLDLGSKGEIVAKMLEKPINVFKNEVLLVDPLSYDIYQLNNGSTKLRYRIDFGKYRFTSKELKSLSNYDKLSEIRKGNKASTIRGIIRCERFIIFGFVFGKEYVTLIRDLNNATNCFLSDYVNSKLLPNCWIFKENSGKFYALIQPDDFIAFQKSSAQFTDIVVDENSNPLIISFTLR